MNRLYRVFKHPLVLSFLLFNLWMAVIVAIHIIGIRQLGSLAAWNDWVAHHGWYARAWRLCVYGAVAYGLWWRRQRLLGRDNSPDMRRALLRTNLAAFALIAFGEFQATMRQG